MTRKLLILAIMGLFVFTSLALATDLKWRSPIEISPAAPNSGDTVTFRCKLKSGGGPADGILVEGRIDGNKVWDHTYPHFDTDEFTWVEFTWLATGGTHTVAFVIDPSNTTVDSNTNNNERSTTFNVSGSGDSPPGSSGSGEIPGAILKKVVTPKLKILNKYPGIVNLCADNENATTDLYIVEFSLKKLSPTKYSYIFKYKNDGKKCHFDISWLITDSFGNILDKHVLIGIIMPPISTLGDAPDYTIMPNQIVTVTGFINKSAVQQTAVCGKKFISVKCSKAKVTIDNQGFVAETNESNNDSAVKVMLWLN